MNDPQFVISGKERREKKRELHGMRHEYRNFWNWIEPNEALIEERKRLKLEIEALERLLARQIGEK
jgi:hypothetical protein